MVTYNLYSVRRGFFMQTKLTLRLEGNLIQMIKQFAFKNNMTLSKFTEMLYLRYLNFNRNEINNKLTFTEKYSGILKGVIDKEDKVISEYLMKKHK